MARLHVSRLCVCAALYVAFALPLVAARLGGRSCHTSFFFPDLSVSDNNDLRTLTLLRGPGSDENGASADFKIFSVASARLHRDGWIGRHRPPPNLVQVRLLNLHRQALFHPGFHHTLDLPLAWRDTATIEKPSAHNELVHTWTFSTSNPHRPITWIDVHSRRGMWHHEFSNHIEQKPLNLDNNEWQWTVKDLWRLAFGLLLGAASGMVFAVILTLVWSLICRVFMHSNDDDDVGFLYGYQELPSPRLSEKDNVKGSQEEFTKEAPGKVENM